MRNPLEPKIAFITGGSSGIGLELARLLTLQGVHIWLVARREALLAQAVASLEEIRQNSAQVIGYSVCDVTDPAQVAAALAQLAQRVGAPDLVINSAGFAQPGYFHEQEPDLFHYTMDVNYFGALNVIRAALPEMMKRRSGVILNIASEAAFISLFGYSAYAASKAALAAFSDSLRYELKAHGIQLSIAYTPDMDTPQLEYETRFQPPEVRALAPLRTVYDPQVIARQILKSLARGEYAILPGFDAKLMYFLVNILGRKKYPVVDLVMKIFWRLNRGNPRERITKQKEV